LGAAAAAPLVGATLACVQAGTGGPERTASSVLNFLRSFRVTLDFETERLLLERP
jgi:hypothetical protein